MCANCHVVSVRVQLNDLGALNLACKRLGWKLNIGATSYRWYGRWVGDSPLPEHLLTPNQLAQVKAMPRNEQSEFMNNFLAGCDHSISIPNSRYEVGIRLTPGGHAHLLWDWYDPKMFDHMGTTGEPLLHAYAVERAKQEAALNGHYCTEHQLSDGTTQLRIEIME